MEGAFNRPFKPEGLGLGLRLSWAVSRLSWSRFMVRSYGLALWSGFMIEVHGRGRPSTITVLKQPMKA
jgi:hypothetical protein